MKLVCSTVAIVLLGAVFTAGCAQSEATVSGRISVDGAPLALPAEATGTVTFTPVKPGPLAQGQIDPSGSYTLSTGSEGGLPAGNYQVTVVATEMPPLDPNNRAFVPVPKRLTPPKYGDAQTSGLTWEVKPGANKADFNLDTK
jgi:hypothetical protein